MSSLLIKNIGILATPISHSALKGDKQKEVSFLKDTFVYIEDGVIKKVGGRKVPNADKVVDAKGMLVTPGLIDCHTHLVFGGDRSHEMSQKLKGLSYLEILESGGGILSTVTSTRNATKKQLSNKAKQVLQEMMKLGTTTCEAKSGYGLDLIQEVKQLEVVKDLNKQGPMELVSTFMAAHALPKEFSNNRQGYIDEIINNMLPYVAKNKLAEFCDVFCEKGVFNVSESKKVLLAAQKHGLKSKIHADEIEAIGGSKLAGEINAISSEHLIVCNDAGIKSLAKGNTIACLLPATSLYLNSTFAPARKMIDKNVAVALASDYNPGSCPSYNMQLVMNLGCLKYKMTPEEVLNAVTINAAACINRANKIGSIEVGKQADILIWKCKTLDYVCYAMGGNLVNKVIKKGVVVK